MLSKFKNVKSAIVAMAVLAGVVSAFVDNVATVLMIAPIALAVCKKQNMSPVAPIIAIAVSSNLQGAATLVGDTTSILLGGYADIKGSDMEAYFRNDYLACFNNLNKLMKSAILNDYEKKYITKICLDEWKVLHKGSSNILTGPFGLGLNLTPIIFSLFLLSNILHLRLYLYLS